MVLSPKKAAGAISSKHQTPSTYFEIGIHVDSWLIFLGNRIGHSSLTMTRTKKEKSL
jgi:hypothetical protein